MSWTTNCATSAIVLTLSRPPAATAPRVSDRGLARQKDPRDLAVRPDDRDLHAPERNEAATVITDAPTLRKRTLHSKSDAGAVREHDNIFKRPTFDRAGE